MLFSYRLNTAGANQATKCTATNEINIASALF